MGEQEPVCAECGLPGTLDYPLTDWAGTLFHGSDELCIKLLRAALAAERGRWQRARELALEMWEHAGAYGDYEIPPSYVHNLMYHLAPDVMQDEDEAEARRQQEIARAEAETWTRIRELQAQTNTPDEMLQQVLDQKGLNAVLAFLQERSAQAISPNTVA